MKSYFKFAVLLAWIGSAAAENHSLLGYRGLLIVPTAFTAPDGDLTFGVNRIPKLYADRYKPYDRTVFFVNFGFTSFLEATFAIVRPDHFPGGVGDRTAAIRVNVLREKRFLPAVTIGAHDFFAVRSMDLEPVEAQHFSAFYMVCSKRLHWQGMRWGAHLGRGFPKLLPARDRLLTGWFAGLELAPLPNVEILLENDSKSFNAGFRLALFRRLSYSFSFWKMRYPMHHLGFTLPLLEDSVE